MNSLNQRLEIVRNVAVTNESSVVSCHFSNALNIFKGNSILITDKFEKDQYRYFLKLKDQWETETIFLSSSTDIYNNSAYKKIIRQGKKAIPWIIRDLRKTDNHWFYALRAITGVNPVKTEHYGVVDEMKKDWIDWAEQNNYS